MKVGAATSVPVNHGLQIDGAAEVSIVYEAAPGAKTAKMIFLQGKPIDEPVVQRGPFVANSKESLMEIMARYQRTEFGGWPWPSHDPSHPRGTPRFARYPDGHEEYPDGKPQDKKKEL